MFQPVTGYLYFIQMDLIGPIKIGITKDIKKRMNQLQNANPYKLHLLCLTPGNEEEERQLHECFLPLWIRGEWFHPHKEIFDQIEEFKHSNRINNFISPDPKRDFGDWSLGSSRWDELEAQEQHE